MTFVDTTITPEAGYTYINHRQMYDMVASGMTTHPAWDYVESVDAISGAVTYRRYVWKCRADQSGLMADFFVVFEVPFLTATGQITGWYTGSSGQYIRVYMGETYAAGVLGKFASNSNSITLAADLSNPATFTLATYAVPTTLNNVTNGFGMNADTTSLRFYCVVAKDVLLISRAFNASGGSPAGSNTLYVGAYDSLLSPVDDPFPIIILGTNYSSGTWYGGGATRAPTFTPSTAYTDVLTVLNGFPGSSSLSMGAGGSWALSTNLTQGTLGSPATTTWYKTAGGPLVSRLFISTACTAANASTKSLFRGYLKYAYGGNLATNAYGDNFLVDGKVMVSNAGTALLLDTTAV